MLACVSAIGPTAEMVIPIEVDYDASFPASDIAAWEQEYENCVRSIEGWRETNFNEGKTRTKGRRPTSLAKPVVGRCEL